MHLVPETFILISRYLDIFLRLWTKRLSALQSESSELIKINLFIVGGYMNGSKSEGDRESLFYGIILAEFYFNRSID